MDDLATCNGFGHRNGVGVRSNNGREKIRLDPQAAWPLKGGVGAGARGVPSERVPLYLGRPTEDRSVGNAGVVVSGSNGGVVGRARQLGAGDNAKKAKRWR